MNQLLKAKQVVTIDSSGTQCEVEQFLGGGGQGEVYQASLGGKPMALKWYLPGQATQAQRDRLERLISKGPPTNKFLWPLELVSAQGVPGFGYLMPLRDPRYKGIVDLMKRRVAPTFRALATAGFELSHSYLELHSKGMCYRDISFGNVFFNPDDGDVLICDNDNVAVDDTDSGAVLGTPRFMAPEIVRGEAMPSTETDLFSLSVLLFYMFMMHHPLDGRKELAIKCLDLPAMTRLYGAEAVFIFDPNDRSNEPVSGYHDNALAFWRIYPQFLQDLFIRAFVDGIHDPRNGRVRESEWRAAMVRLRDWIIYCPSCTLENFYDADVLSVSGGQPAVCWHCKSSLTLPARIRIGRSAVMLNHDSQLFPHHIDDLKMFDFSKAVAAVSRHPSDPRVWGLKNLSNEKWVSTAPNGEVRDVEPGRSVALAVGTRIHFGRMAGEIRL